MTQLTFNILHLAMEIVEGVLGKTFKSNCPINQSQFSSFVHLGVYDVVKMMCWCSKRASEWGQEETEVALNVVNTGAEAFFINSISRVSTECPGKGKISRNCSGTDEIVNVRCLNGVTGQWVKYWLFTRILRTLKVRKIINLRFYISNRATFCFLSSRNRKRAQAVPQQKRKRKVQVKEQRVSLSWAELHHGRIQRAEQHLINLSVMKQNVHQLLG